MSKDIKKLANGLVNFEELTKKERDEFIGQCGPATWPISFNVIDIIEACKEHDWNYQRGGTSLDRFYADEKFYKTSTSIILSDERLSPSIKSLLINITWIYYVLIRIFGHFAFEYGSPKTKEEILAKAGERIRLRFVNSSNARVY